MKGRISNIVETSRLMTLSNLRTIFSFVFLSQTVAGLHLLSPVVASKLILFAINDSHRSTTVAAYLRRTSQLFFFFFFNSSRRRRWRNVDRRKRAQPGISKKIVLPLSGVCSLSFCHHHRAFAPCLCDRVMSVICYVYR